MPADFDDAGHRGKRPAGEDAGLHPRPAVERPGGGGPLAAPYVKVKLDAIASEQFTPQMQLAHALKDARLALSTPSRTPCRGWKTSPNCGSRRRTRICRRGFVCGISVAVAVVKSVVSYPRRKEVAMVATYPGGWGINSNLSYVSLSYQSIRSGADSAGDNSVPTPPAASGR